MLTVFSFPLGHRRLSRCAEPGSIREWQPTRDQLCARPSVDIQEARSDLIDLAIVQVKDPTSSDFGAGAPSNFQGHIQAKKAMNAEAGVIEGQPGIIESSNIDPLDPNSNKGVS